MECTELLFDAFVIIWGGLKPQFGAVISHPAITNVAKPKIYDGLR